MRRRTFLQGLAVFVVTVGTFCIDMRASIADDKTVDAEPSSEQSNNHDDDGVMILAPSGGVIRHVLSATGRAPEQVGWGPYTGLFYGWMRKDFSLIALPSWADANGSYVYGITTHFDYYFDASERIKPLAGLGFAAIRIDDKDTSVGDITVLAPWPKAGVRFIMPIEGLSIDPYASYLYQHVDMHQMMGGDREYHSALFGMNIHYDFRHFLRFTLKYYYRLTHDGRDGSSVRFRTVCAFTKHVGAFLRVDYSRQVVDEYVTVLAGPAIVF